MNSLKVSSHLQRWTALSSLALLGSTWRLWIPQAEYPQVPVLDVLCNAPDWLDWLALSGLTIGLVTVVIAKSARTVRCACGIVCLSMLLSMNLDQHRFQPWAYELGLFCSIWICCGSVMRLRLMRWLLISIYCYSAIGKLDFEFLHTVGQQMLAVVAQNIGQNSNLLPSTLRLALAGFFPLTELAIGLGLACPRTRRLAGGIAIGLHLGLILILGPLGLNHRLGVLIWNIQVALQVYWLFLAKQSAEPECTRTLVTETHALPLAIDQSTSNLSTRDPSTRDPSTSRPAAGRLAPNRFPAERLLRERVGIAIVILAIALPSTERWEMWDHWPSWALYAPHSSRVSLEVAVTAVARLPAALQDVMRGPIAAVDEIAIWVQVPIDAWSLQALDTPIYPQARFQLGVAEQIAREINSESQVRITQLSAASRFTGTRSARTYASAAELKNAQQQFFLNCHPRHRLNESRH